MGTYDEPGTGVNRPSRLGVRVHISIGGNVFDVNDGDFNIEVFKLWIAACAPESGDAAVVSEQVRSRVKDIAAVSDGMTSLTTKMNATASETPTS